MKKAAFLLLVLLLMGCAEKDCLFDPDEFPARDEMSVRETSAIQVHGDTYFLTIGDKNLSIQVEPIAIAEGFENVNLDDTTYASCLEISFEGIVPRMKKLSSEVVFQNDDYIVRKVTYQANFILRECQIPITFVRNTVSIPMPADGNGIEWENEAYHSFSFRITSQYLSTQPGDGGKQFARTYHALSVDVSLNGVDIGTLNTVMSFYTLSHAITFGATVDEINDVDVSYEL